MGTYIKADGTIADPLASNPYIEKDWGIIRGVTKAMFDFSNEECCPQTGEITGAMSLHNLVDGGGSTLGLPANAGSKFQAVYQGTLKMDGTTSAGGHPTFNLPDADFNFDADARHGLIILHALFSASGYLASQFLGLMANGTDTSTNMQYSSYLHTNGSGVPDSLVFRLRGTSGNIDLSVTGSALTALCDGNLHQLGIAIDIAGGVGQATLYMDGEVLQVGGSGAMTQFNQPGTPTAVFLAALGTGNFTSGTMPSVRFGRLSVHDLTDRDDVTVASLLARDAEAADGYVY